MVQLYYLDSRVRMCMPFINYIKERKESSPEERYSCRLESGNTIHQT